MCCHIKYEINPDLSLCICCLLPSAWHNVKLVQALLAARFGQQHITCPEKLAPLFQPAPRCVATCFLLLRPCALCLLISKSFECYYSVIYSTPAARRLPPAFLLPHLSVCTHVHKCNANRHSHSDTNTRLKTDTH